LPGRQAKHWGAGNGAEHERPGGPQGDPPGVQLAVEAKHLLEMILSPDGGATDGNQGVAVLGGMQQCGGEHAVVIVNRAQGRCDASDIDE
jgi:hypothetical protein